MKVLPIFMKKVYYQEEKTILLVDDDKAILNSLELLLELSGYKVISTAQGSKTIPLASRNQPDLILLDMYLSGTTGKEICQKLKILEKTKDIPVIMISAHPKGGVESVKAGADYFLAKPFDITKLLKLLNSTVN